MGGKLRSDVNVRRKQLLEAWESAEWESREAQIRALQEAQLKEFEESIKAKHAQVALTPLFLSCCCFPDYASNTLAIHNRRRLCISASFAKPAL